MKSGISVPPLTAVQLTLAF